ncbi:ferredoxin [Brachybacterium sp. P6-10-X1]|uniref:ferredoxin n=1 Tax=Brachybacterium sp. P6-10-X1 TaxID=1903186 RepID=UPI00097633EF|nr:ferredoxin [Brachybacterium sp. P6-10-X1]
MKITVHSAMCVASGNCSRVAPDVFQNREENGGFVELRDSNPPESEWDAAREAEYLCPSGTIQIENQPIPPRQ